MKDKTEKLLNLNTAILVLFHFIACGLPALLAIAGSVAGMYFESPFGGWLPQGAMTALLIASGTALAVSWAVFLKVCRCRDGKARRLNKIGLIIASAMYIIALAGHFAPVGTTDGGRGAEMACH